MALVEFINDSEPYLNAENLNNNFQPHEITIGLNTEYTYNNTTRGIIPLDVQISKIGNKLSFDSTNNCILVGNNVDYIEISGGSLQKSSAVDLCGFLITKNGITLSDSVSTNFHYISTVNQLHRITASPVLVPVSAGDKIYLVGYVNSGNIAVTLTPYSGKATYLTARVVS